MRSMTYMKTFALGALFITLMTCFASLSFASDALVTHNPKSDPYRLSPGDHLRIYVFGVEELSGDYRVDGKGNVTIPLIGEMSADGLDKQELQKRITLKLVDGGYFNDPKVTVEIIALQPFYILGEVKNPGSYDFEPELNLFKAIAIAGGYTPRASKGKAIIIRKIHGDKIEIQATEDTPILPGDSIKIKQRFF